MAWVPTGFQVLALPTAAPFLLEPDIMGPHARDPQGEGGLLIVPGLPAGPVNPSLGDFDGNGALNGLDAQCFVESFLMPP